MGDKSPKAKQRARKQDAARQAQKKAAAAKEVKPAPELPVKGK